MRMVALGQLLHDEGNVVHFATLRADDDTRLRLETEGFSVHALPGDLVAGSPGDASALRNVAAGLRADWLVLDGYAFETDYQRAVKGVAANLLSVDDLAKCHFVGDVVLNQNYGAERKNYSTEPGTKRLLGPGFVLLRREFRNATPRPLDQPPPSRLLLSLGGGTNSAADALATIVEGLAQLDRPDLRVHVIAGRFATNGDAENRLASSKTHFRIVPHADDMAAAMADADVAITSGGSTTWELMRMRIPFLAVALNEPQREFLASLARDGLCDYIGPAGQLDASGVRRAVEAFLADPARRRAIAEAGGRLIDPERATVALRGVFADQPSNPAT